MSVKRWVELSCDECLEPFGGLRFQEGTNINALRLEARELGWISCIRNGERIDLCPTCKS